MRAASHSPEADACLKEATAWLKGRHAAETVLRIWGGGAGLTLEETKASMRSLMEEYCSR